MRPRRDSLAAAIRSYKELTAETDQAAATRARVLAAADLASRRRVSARHLWLPTVVGLVVAGGASLAGTMMVKGWRRPVVAIEDDQLPTGSPPGRFRRSVVIPPAPAEATRSEESDAPETEAAVYDRAHRAHFVDQNPARALAAWDRYLRLYPAGTFEPEARFNRAVCLVHLRRFAEARRALRPFVANRYGDYRRADAGRLLDWLPGPPPAP